MQLISLVVARIGFLLGALLIALTANAQTEGLRVGVVNVTRLLEQAPQVQAAMAGLQAEFAPRQQEFEALQVSYQENQEVYQRDGAVMGETERLDLERQLRDGERVIQREQNELIEDFNIRRNEELGVIQGFLLQEVQTYAQAEGYDLIVADVLYFSEGIDITDDVLQRLQANFSTDDGGS